jgi:hypothetical protein
VRGRRVIGSRNREVPGDTCRKTSHAVFSVSWHVTLSGGSPCSRLPGTVRFILSFLPHILYIP